MDIKYMKLALAEAKKAYLKNEAPIGCVIVKNDEVIAKAHNLRELKNKVTAHAEILAIEKANKKLNSWRLDECDLYVTLEPCIMCSGAIIQARIKNLYFGAYDPRFGACGSYENIFDKKYNHEVNVVGGILESDCSKLIKDFFKTLRS
ncbi:MAG: nucleoside deaminase [Acholeplasmatales bacterium]|nr:nucleoside deaminase [Acholeplasmatales bacterium]